VYGEVTHLDSVGDPIQTLDYAYDVLDRRIEKSDTPAVGPAYTERYVYDGEHLALKFGASSLANRYLHGPVIDQILADEQVSSLSSPGDVLWSLVDHLGTVRDLAEYDSGTGNTVIVNHISYDAYGGSRAETNAAVDHLFGYTGREWDAEADLQYNRARWYDPAVGRWLSEDPIGFEAGDANLARYVGNEPTGYVDPRGLFKSVDPAVHAEITRQALASVGVNPAHAIPRIIVTQNSMTDADRLFVAEYHAQATRFPNVLQALMKEIVAKNPTTQQEHAEVAALMGNALHILQDFYSHTDWIDGRRLIPNYLWYRNRPEYGSEGEAILMQQSMNHTPHNTTIDLNAIYTGDFSQINGVIIFDGGFDPRATARNSLHNRYAADENGFGRDDPSRGGQADSFETAKRLALQQSVEFLLWVRNNSQNGGTIDYMRDANPIKPQ
jgi:RHS repeat-associated protein